MDFATNRRLGDLSATGALRCPSRWWRRGGRRGVPLVGGALAMLTMGAGPAFSASDPQPVHRVADGGIFDVSSYQIAMSYQPDAGTVQGSTLISATAKDVLDRLTLNVSGLNIRSVTVNSQEVTSFTRVGEKDLVIAPAKPLQGGTRFQVRVTYDGKPGDGWLPTTSGGATALEGSSSAWFPAHEDRHDRADFQLTATVPAGWSVVSIGRESAGPAGAVQWTEPDVDPAHIAVSIDRFTIERSSLPGGTPVVNAYAPGLKEATEPLADRLPEIIGFLSTRFGPYPFRAAGNVFVQIDDDAPATAPQTRPVFLGAGNKQFMNLDAVVHEQAHQWYANATAVQGSDDDCLDECVASYATWLWDENQDGTDLDARYREQVDADQNDTGFWAALYTPGVAAGINLYSKGPLALHALRRQIGDQAFQQLIRQWPQEHRGDYVTWPQFEQFATKIARQDLTGFFQAWFRSSTVPSAKYLWPGALRP
jgi:aminopeptidase N